MSNSTSVSAVEGNPIRPINGTISEQQHEFLLRLFLLRRVVETGIPTINRIYQGKNKPENSCQLCLRDLNAHFNAKLLLKLIRLFWKIAAISRQNCTEIATRKNVSGKRNKRFVKSHFPTSHMQLLMRFFVAFSNATFVAKANKRRFHCDFYGIRVRYFLHFPKIVTFRTCSNPLRYFCDKSHRNRTEIAFTCDFFGELEGDKNCIEVRKT